MLMTKETIDQLAGYLGSTPIPEDFDTFWAARMAEADKFRWTTPSVPRRSPPSTPVTTWIFGFAG